MKYLNTVITGTGSFIPSEIVKNSDFANHEFFDENHVKLDAPGEIIIQKFKEITGIEERRYVKPELHTSDIAAEAARIAIADAGIDAETLDYIILAHNFGDIIDETIQTDNVPSLASRVKNHLQIANPACVAFDVLFGCPGWIQGVLMADAFFKAGVAKKILVIGAETLSRVCDPHDRDSMIYADGAGATVLEAVQGDTRTGLLSSAAATYAKDEARFLFMGKSNKPLADKKIRYIKMYGRKIYEFALSKVPIAMKDALDKAQVDIADVKKILIHQANEKMDEAIVKRFYKLYKISDFPKDIMPMSIQTLGNSSVATVPTLLDMIRRGLCEDHQFNTGDIISFASVGAGMNINSFVYKY